VLRTDLVLAQDRFFARTLEGSVVAAVAAGFFVFDLSHSCYDYQASELKCNSNFDLKCERYSEYLV
jgi:hypothetical protein